MLLEAEAAEGVPALSPDGRWLAHYSDETGPPLIYVKPFPNVDEPHRERDMKTRS